MQNGPLLIRCGSCRTLNRVAYDRLSSHPICGHCKARLEAPRAPINVTTAHFDQQVRDWPEFLLVVFWASWCGYCRMLEPFINELAAKRAGRLKIIRVDVEAEPALHNRFLLRATPTFLLYRNGIQLERLDGAPQQSSDLALWIDQVMERSSARV